MSTTVVLTTVGGPWLAHQLAALAVQTVRPDQVVLVNNGPRGAVDAVLAAAALPGIELVEDDTVKGVSHARNAGAARARHEHLLFLDDDDVAGPTYVAAMDRALREHALVAARIDLDRLNRPALIARWGSMQVDGPMTYHGFLPWAVGGTTGVRRELFERVGGFDTGFAVVEDTDFCWRAQLDGGADVGFAVDAELSYRLRSRVAPAFRQARNWARWERALHGRFGDRGLPAPDPALRRLRRWARPVQVALTARRHDDLVVAARLLGSCLGRAQRTPAVPAPPAARRSRSAAA